ncbi:hypothetical protein AAHC03_09207 [Spirometra sp. Aus1]
MQLPEHLKMPLNTVKACLSKELGREHNELKKCIEPADLVPAGASTQEHYEKASNLPERFNHPEILNAYGSKPDNPMYQTTNSEYGKFKPTIHTMCTEYHQRNSAFSKRYWGTGNYRNHSLNTAKDPSII